MNTNQLAEELREALEEAGLLNYGPQSTPKARHIIKAIIEKATEGARDENTAHQLTIAKLQAKLAHANAKEYCSVCGSLTDLTKEQLAHEVAKLIKLGAYIEKLRAGHASGQDESKAKRTARAIRSIAERAGLKITDDVELAWRDAILYALPAAHASKPRIPEQSSDNMSPAAHANTCPECGTAWPRHKGLCGGQPPPIPTVATAE